MKYIDFQLIWRFESMIFKAKHFFCERSLHTAVHKLRGTSFTLRHAVRKKYFFDLLYHLGQKMRLAFKSMTFQTFCIFWTGYPPPLWTIFNKPYIVMWSFGKPPPSCHVHMVTVPISWTLYQELA